MRKPIRRFPFKPKPITLNIEEKKPSFMEKLGKLAVRFFAGIGVLFFITVIGYGLLLNSLFKSVKPDLPQEIVLAYHFHGELSELSSKDPLSFGSSRLPLSELVDVMHKAKNDDRVKAFVARISDLQMSQSQIYELEVAIESFRASSKKAYVFSDSFGEAGNGMSEYYLASAFDEIWMQPIGSLGINGYNLEGLYFKNLLDRFKVVPQFFKREEFKSAMEMLTRSSQSNEAKQNTKKLLDDIADIYVTRVSDNRNLEKEKLESLINLAPLTDEMALKEKLIDKLGFVDELLSALKNEYQIESVEDHFVTLSAYASEKSSIVKMDRKMMGQRVKSDKSYVAEIIMKGMILSGSKAENGYSPLSNAQLILSRDYASAITKAADDKDVSGILIRIDSPGGSPVASEAIRRAIIYAREVKEKPVVLSMGMVVASGGYWIASAADHIVAAPNTITGSIGAISGKVSLGDALAEQGINSDGVQYGENADFLSPFKPFDKAGTERMNVMIDNIYDGFIARVAQGRGLNEDTVRDLAGGRIWSGKAALEQGLVDSLGGQYDAKQALAERIGADLSEIVFEQYPKPKTAFEELIALISGNYVLVPQGIKDMATLFQLNQTSAVQVLYYQ